MSLSPAEPLLGYVYDAAGKHGPAIYLTAEQVPAFIMAYQTAPKLIITDFLDYLVLSVVYGLIDQCGEPTWLMETLLPVLVPMQEGEADPPPFAPLTEADWTALLHKESDAQ